MFCFVLRNVAGSLSPVEFLSKGAEVQGQTLDFPFRFHIINYPRYFLRLLNELVHKHCYYFHLADWGSDWDEDKMDHWASRIDWVTHAAWLIISHVYKVQTFLENSSLLFSSWVEIILKKEFDRIWQGCWCSPLLVDMRTVKYWEKKNPFRYKYKKRGVGLYDATDWFRW